MSTALIDRALPTDTRRAGAYEGSAEAPGAGGGLTLGEAISGAWEDLSARAVAACPVCGDELAPPTSAVGPARCRGCGSELS